MFSNGEPAALSDGVVGEPVRGAYKKTEAGLLEVVTVHFGTKTGEKPNPETSASTKLPCTFCEFQAGGNARFFFNVSTNW